MPFPGTSAPVAQTPPPVAPPPAPPKLTASQKRRLEQRQQTLEDERTLRDQKLRQLRKSLAIETGEAIKFQLQQQIQDEEAKLATLDDELDAIDQTLQSNAG